MKQVSPGLLLFGFFAILIGLAGAYVVKRALSTPAPVAEPVPKVKLYSAVLAAIDLVPGRVIRNGDVMNVSLTKAQYMARHWPAVMLSDTRQIIGRMVQHPIHKGEPFEPDAFYPEGTGPDIAARLKDGLRAVMVSVQTDGLPSKAEPGSFVDVIFRSTATKDKDKDKDLSIPEVTRVLMQNVEILAIGENATPGIQGDSDPKAETHAITLAVSPDQAMRLKVAEGNGTLSLALRNPHVPNEVSSMMSSLTLREMLALPPPVPPEQPFVAEIYRGGRRQTLTFLPKRKIVEEFGGVPIQRGQPADAPKEPTDAPDARGVPDQPPATVPPANKAPAPADDPFKDDMPQSGPKAPKRPAPPATVAPPSTVSQLRSGLDAAAFDIGECGIVGEMI